jgi:hypothetical protein
VVSTCTQDHSHTVNSACMRSCTHACHHLKELEPCVERLAANLARARGWCSSDAASPPSRAEVS